MNERSVVRPRVSICLPNLNTRPFLESRVDSILRQTFTDWELIISDNLSDDGAWEFFQRLAESDARVSIAQEPRKGLYANWNNCLRRARGEFVYIATSDDLMPPDCIEKLVEALDRNPDCDIAHCPLWPLDERGATIDALSEWWWQRSLFAQSSGELVQVPHVRPAPLDGLLHLLGGSVYISITQLLVRRRLFDRIGPFEPGWGSVGDFNWNMRAGLVANTVHVPATCGGWRLHASQATASVAFGTEEFAVKLEQMIRHAVDSTGPLLSPELRSQLESFWLPATHELRDYLLALRRRPSALSRAWYSARSAIAGSAPARAHLRLRLLRRPLTDWIVERAQKASPSISLRLRRS